MLDMKNIYEYDSQEKIPLQLFMSHEAFASALLNSRSFPNF